MYRRSSNIDRARWIGVIAILARLLTASLLALSAQAAPDGARAFVTRDPDGHFIEVLQSSTLIQANKP